jgi:NAD(P)-dependent dehydrogenase (short-subunit alcohol dehydrogenase family)
LKKIDTQYNNIVIFNGIYSSSFLTNFNKKEFLKVFNINYTIPIEIASILIQNKIVKKNGSIIFISSIAADEELIGNAYYSISKHALNFSSKILSNEQRLRGIRINTVSIGLVKNSMGLSAKNLSNTKKKFISINNIVKKFKILLNNSKINCKNIKITQ